MLLAQADGHCPLIRTLTETADRNGPTDIHGLRQSKQIWSSSVAWELSHKILQYTQNTSVSSNNLNAREEFIPSLKSTHSCHRRLLWPNKKIVSAIFKIITTHRMQSISISQLVKTCCINKCQGFKTKLLFKVFVNFDRGRETFSLPST